MQHTDIDIFAFFFFSSEKHILSELDKKIKLNLQKRKIRIVTQILYNQISLMHFFNLPQKINRQM